MHMKLRYLMLNYVRCVYCDAQNEWVYQPLGMEHHVNEWLAHLNSLTWDTLKEKVRQFADDYLQLAKTRWTVWDPRRGEYAFQVSGTSVTTRNYVMGENSFINVLMLFCEEI